MKNIKSKLFFAISFLLVLHFIILSYLQPIQFITEDLGRHITNGYWIINSITHHFSLFNNTPLYHNFYSYTEPNFKADNHHWLFGIIIFFVHKAFGFEGVSIFSAGLIMIALAFIYLTAKELSNKNFAWLVLAFLLPPLCWRIGPRPELFSYVFFGLEFYLLTLYKFQKLSQRTLQIAMFIIMALWINIHIFFIFGFFLIALFYLNSLKRSDFDPQTHILKQITIKNPFAPILFTSFFALFINPFSFRAIVEPFLIFKLYGYEVLENQPVIFLHKRFPWHPVYIHYELTSLVLLFSFIQKLCINTKNKFDIKDGWKNLQALIMRKQNPPSLDLMNFILCLAVTIVGFRVNRIVTLANFCFVPILAYNFYSRKDFYLNLISKIKVPRKLIYFASILGFLFFFNVLYTKFLRRNIWIKYEAMPNAIHRSATFIKTFDIKGPILNNYDIGGYFIYHLFPKWKCFVDNRPEAYSYNFFKQVYVPMLAKEDYWRFIDSKYNFNVIYFYRHDLTRFAQPFLIRRTQDPNWVPVYVDKWTIILLKNNEQNQELIKRFHLPRSMFKAKKK